MGCCGLLVSYPLDFVREIGDLIAAICGACTLPIVLLHRNNITLRVFENIPATRRRKHLRCLRRCADDQ